jgi:HSP20 family protein
MKNTLVKTNGHKKVDPSLRDFFDVENIFTGNWNNNFGKTFPSVNISEDDQSFCVDVVAPGFRKEDFKVNVEDDVLTISAETETQNRDEEDNQREYSRREYSYNSFTRSFRLPENAKDNEVSATYKDGILELNIPKTENPAKEKKEIQVS